LLKARDIPFCLIATWQSYESVLKLPGIFRKPHKFLPAFIKRQLILITYRQAQLLFASSDHTGKELSHFFNVRPERIITCYLGVSPEFARLPRSKPEQIKRFLFFGRLSESKGIQDAIQAFRKLSALGYQDWRFDLYGDGDQNWIRSIIEAEGLEQQIAVHASLPDQALKNALVDAHLVILPSHIEAFGLAFAESQAAGLPVVAYEAGSVPEVVAHGQTGWLAPLGDTDQLAAYLRQAIDNLDQAFQMGLAGRERVKQLFTWQKTGDKILNGLKKLDKEPRS
jgi:glycosyltransferase involved in cell wall biosynthesis